MNYDFEAVEAKWRDFWQERRFLNPNLNAASHKYYFLNMFPYPKGQHHVAHARHFFVVDAYTRYLIMNGYNVLSPLGYDAFGLPAENAAIKHGLHPKTWTYANIDAFRRQFYQWGLLFDSEREIATCEPAYYRWSQWLFLQLYKQGLAYRKPALVHWCPSCNTVLANEQVGTAGEQYGNGRCDRCGSSVVSKYLTQWFFHITRYAAELLDALDGLEYWPEHVKTMQRNWIGRRTGILIRFPIVGRSETLEAFTATPECILNAAYLLLAPRHPLIHSLISDEQREKLIRQVQNTNKAIGSVTEPASKGGFLGTYALNPVTGSRLPLWVAESASLQQDQDIIIGLDKEKADRDAPTINLSDVSTQQPESPFSDDTKRSRLRRCLEEKTTDEVVEFLEEEGLGQRWTTYRLRDWLISRQRYWGTPIPIIYCEHCGIVPVPEEVLPVLLPEVESLGNQGLSDVASFYQTTCPQCGEAARRETDTMDTFVDSSWYYLRYLSPRDNSRMFDLELARNWMPVDQYIGQVSYSTSHLLYARFIAKALRDLGIVNFDEPFRQLFTMELINHRTFRCENHGWFSQDKVSKGGCCPDCGERLDVKLGSMSHSKQNFVSIFPLCTQYGVDTVRLYTLFLGPLDQEVEWVNGGIKGCKRFLNRLWKLVHESYDLQHRAPICNHALAAASQQDPEGRLWSSLNQMIAEFTDNFEKFRFHRAISNLMELVNEVNRYCTRCEQLQSEKNRSLMNRAIECILLLISPITPFIAEELWSVIGQQSAILDQNWPRHDPLGVLKHETEIVVQIDGKIHGRIVVSVEVGQDSAQLQKAARSYAQAHLDCEIEQVVVVPGRLVNLVTP